MVNGLAKAYQVYAKPQHRFLQSLLRGRRTFFREFWALRDVSFTVGRGETVGILGRNGSGKSTLLQLIAGTLEPTAGSVRVKGRTSAILELGAGFNPEFTGRENIVVSTAVAGMTEDETISRMPRIIEFADIGDFIDQPVKTYSSGMYARLAFAVAIHVNPAVLIVDEALAVGDAKFQAQCFRKFEEFKKRGVTILFVTHSTEQIARHCTRALLLEQGQLVMNGEPKVVVARYLELLFGVGGVNKAAGAPPASSPADVDPRRLFADSSSGGEAFALRGNYNRLEHRWGDGRARIVDFVIVDAAGNEAAYLRTGNSYAVCIRVHFHDAVLRPIYGLSVKTPDGMEIAGNNTRDVKHVSEFTPRATGDEVYVRFDFECVLNSGEFLLSVGVAEDAEGGVVPLDRRYDSIHIAVANSRKAFGLVELGIRTSEMATDLTPGDAAAGTGAAVH
ncbi:MAG: ABC transporter ATP-binding protein [Burkholderiales bacterium]